VDRIFDQLPAAAGEPEQRLAVRSGQRTVQNISGMPQVQLSTISAVLRPEQRRVSPNLLTFPQQVKQTHSV